MRNPRPRPKYLSKKLRQIREALGLSQAQMVERLGFEDMKPARISQYERNRREPSLKTLIAYSHVACIHLEDIVNDDLALPATLPGNIHYRGLPYTTSD
jgi:transcriptional regulator with XRE-family HTH domain